MLPNEGSCAIHMTKLFLELGLLALLQVFVKQTVV